MSSSPPSSSSRMVRVYGRCQQYDWGKPGSCSSVAALQRAGNPNAADIEPNAPYAELWMGTHTSGPSTVDVDGKEVLLRDHLGSELPFLFKVLSVGKALSIQAHPDMSLAQSLHATRPNVYKDPFHKPELACALTPFEALCAFRPIDELRMNVSDFPEFATLLGEELTQLLKSTTNTDEPETTKDVLRRMFRAMMTPTPELLASALSTMLTRLASAGVVASTPACLSGATQNEPAVRLEIGPLIMRLAQQYPGDVGIFAPLYLNAFSLRPGESIFLGPNEPHAYLSGDCVECMACSDNVVRAGLTPKLRDTEVLISMLTYEMHTIESVLMSSSKVSNAPETIEFAPPKQFNEFRLLKTNVERGATSVLPQVDGASILIVFSGSATITVDQTNRLDISQGHIVLVPSQSKVNILTSPENGVLIFQCAANSS